jgi:hypothetical protein
MRSITIILLFTFLSLYNCALPTGSQCVTILNTYANSVDLPALIRLWCDFSLSQQNTLVSALYSIKNSKIPNLIGLAALYERMSSANQKVLF